MVINSLHGDLAGFAACHQATHSVCQHSQTIFCIEAKCIFIAHALKARMRSTNHFHAVSFPFWQSHHITVANRVCSQLTLLADQFNDPTRTDKADWAFDNLRLLTVTH